MKLFLIFACMVGLVAGHGPDASCSIFSTEAQPYCKQTSTAFLGFPSLVTPTSGANVSTLEDAFDAMAILQDEYFDADYGTWPSAIEWTGVVVQTIISGMLKTLTKSLEVLRTGNANEHVMEENLISSLFAQIVASYYSQDVISLRGQAYDDILWVVLGWIEALDFVKTHSELRYPGISKNSGIESHSLRTTLDSLPWHGFSWARFFAHRARIFWNLGAKGWETSLCHGGMVWDRRVLPYKNTITNQLWISASAAMYLRFPGDNFTSPWLTDKNTAFPRRDPAHLAASANGYQWLMSVNMTNSQGLFADGYHISQNEPGNVECDLRDETIYTYNQGVLLTGQRGLFIVSGNSSYLEEGHRLIQSAIRSTGWDLSQSRPFDSFDRFRTQQFPPWHGLGRFGILEEQCDASGTCSQDGQAFKGIFFHHFTAFCAPLDAARDQDPDRIINTDLFNGISNAHSVACNAYLDWVEHNAKAALSTKNEKGLFGMWWGANMLGSPDVVVFKQESPDRKAENATDYRNHGVPENEPWTGPQAKKMQLDTATDDSAITPLFDDKPAHQEAIGKSVTKRIPESSGARNSESSKDLNDRGRGRTVETQAGGLAVLRAYWELSQHQDHTQAP